MKRCIGMLLALCLALSLAVCTSVSAFAADDKVIVGGSGTFTVEEAVDRVMAYEDCQNLAGMHEFYHSAKAHREELENVWVYDKEFQKTASWTNNQQYMEGWDNLWGFYVTDSEGGAEVMLEKAMANDTQGRIENSEDWYYTGMFAYHMLMTPVIEVARDGQTAVGIWQSWGTSGSPESTGFNVEWQCEDYSMVFARQSGGDWRIWHLRTFVHFYSQVGEQWYESNTQLGGGGGASGEPPMGVGPASGDGFAPDADSMPPMGDWGVMGDYYEAYSLYCVPVQMTIPEPYDTWDDIKDTFAWGATKLDDNRIIKEFAEYDNYDFSAYKTN
ncbi:MAG: nuclear transport factor 2 family protein [Oscillospiraceae bacterium]